jgi:hypothetical protein
MVLKHTPAAVLLVSQVEQRGSPHVPSGLQVRGAGHLAAPAQTPAAEHTSLMVQASPSLQVAPALTGFEQAPVAGSQVPAEWHWSDAVQVFWVPPQTPAVQTSPVVQALPSLQVLPSVDTGFEQAPVAGSQVPTSWH